VQLSDAAQTALDDLERTGPPGLHHRVLAVLQQLVDDPTAEPLKRRQWRDRNDQPVWTIPVVAGRYDWVILWGQEKQGTWVHYIGPEFRR
jgi:hypothetical protein